MASDPQPKVKALERLEREITCPVCQEYFDSPKMLPCLHYYCKKCILALSRRSQPFRCPECRVATMLPQNDPERLPTAFFVNRIKELYSNMENGEVKAPCEMCSQAISTAFCRQCTYFICAECVKCHHTMKEFVGHNVVSLDELKQGTDSKKLPIKHPPTPTCSVHVNEPFKLYCYECDCLICRDCIVIDHANHKFEFVKKVAAKTRTELEGALSSLEEEQLQLCKSTEAVQATKKNVVVQCMGLMDTIEKSFAQLHDILEDRKRVLIAEVTEIMDEKTSRLDVQGKGFVTNSSTIQCLIDSVKRNIEHTTDDELSAAHKQILSRTDAEIKTVCQVPVDHEPVANVPVEEGRAFTERLKEGCESIATQIGMFPPTCSVEQLVAVEVNQPSQITLNVHTFPRKLERLSVTLKSCVDGSPVHTTCTQKQGRKYVYQVAFTPIIRGRHELKVRVNDVPIAGSPFRVFVNIPSTQIQTPIMVISDEELRKPWGVTLNSSEEVLVTDYFSDRVTAYNKRGNRLYSFKPASNKMCSPQLCGIATDNHDNIFVADAGNNCLYKFNKDGNQVGKIGSSGTEQSKFMNPKGVSIFKDQVFVCDYGNNRIQVFSTELEFVREFGSRGSGNGQFDYVRDIAHDELGNAYVCDSRNHRIQVFDENWNFLYAFNKKGSTGQLKNPANICLSCDQFVYVVENDFSTRCCVSVFFKCGQFVTTFGEAGSEHNQFNTPLGIACDCDGYLYVCDCKNSRVKVF